MNRHLICWYKTYQLSEPESNLGYIKAILGRRKEEKKEGWIDGRADGRTEGRKETDRWAEEQKKKEQRMNDFQK